MMIMIPAKMSASQDGPATSPSSHLSWPVGERQQDQQRAGVGVGAAASEDRAERLSEHPDGRGYDDGKDEGGPGGGPGRVAAGREAAGRYRERDGGGEAVLAAGPAADPVDGGQPARLAGRH